MNRRNSFNVFEPDQQASQTVFEIERINQVLHDQTNTSQEQQMKLDGIIEFME